MKKLSLLIALLICVTIGGVYATWTYTSASADIVDGTKEVVIELAGATTTGAAGEFTVTSNLKLTLDQITLSNGSTNHEAQLVYGTTDSSPMNITITFTPSGNASDEVKNNGVRAELYFSTTTDMNYPHDGNGKFQSGSGTMKDILAFSNEANGTFEGDPNNIAHTHAVKWTKQPDGTFTATYTEAQIKEMIKLNGQMFLDTKADYDAFTSYLTGNIVVHVTDGTVQNSGGSTGQG
ncbi:MAG: hypothetical protein IJF14_05945 [Clostridia bacterium]|nr:hypothetical protein [Clostridia bacterium]